jgi:hypothetical protein
MVQTTVFTGLSTYSFHYSNLKISVIEKRGRGGYRGVEGIGAYQKLDRKNIGILENP